MKIISVIALIIILSLSMILPSGISGQAAKEATIEAETHARIVLQSEISTKLSEPDDVVRAVLGIKFTKPLVLPVVTQALPPVGRPEVTQRISERKQPE